MLEPSRKIFGTTIPLGLGVLVALEVIGTGITLKYNPSLYRTPSATMTPSPSKTMVSKTILLGSNISYHT